MQDEILNNFPLVNYLLSKGAKEIKKNEFLLTCPTCGKEKLTVNISKKLWHCWTCVKYIYDPWMQSKKTIQGAGSLLQLVILFEKISLPEAVAFVTRYSAYRVEKLLSFVDLKLDEKNVTVEAPEYKTMALPECSTPIDRLTPWLVDRGISMADVKHFGLFTCTAGRYGSRLISPVYDNSRLICFQGRAMWWAHPKEKYVKALAPAHQPGYARTSDVLFNLDQAASYPSVAVVEGPIDTIHTGYDSVCTFGKKISINQIKYLLKYKVKAIDLMWDGISLTEPTGAWIEMLCVAPLLSQIFDLRLVFLPKGDPGSLSRGQINEFRSKSVHYSEKMAQKINLQKV